MGLDANADLLRTSFQLVTSRQPDLTTLFYDELFQRYPQTKPLFFRKPREVQDAMLADALTAVLDHLEDTPWLEANLAQLGAKHVEYGVAPEMYGWVGECLLDTIAAVAQDDWTPAHAAAWKEAYTAIATLMLAGRPEPEAATSSAEVDPLAGS